MWKPIFSDNLPSLCDSLWFNEDKISENFESLDEIEKLENKVQALENFFIGKTKDVQDKTELQPEEESDAFEDNEDNEDQHSESDIVMSEEFDGSSHDTPSPEIADMELDLAAGSDGEPPWEVDV